MKNQEATIAAISTPPGSGGIGIIRISGSEACSASDKIFSAHSSLCGEGDRRAEVSEQPTHTIRHGYLYDPETGELLDECMLSVMRAPASYTKEDVVEINCHGSYAVLQRVLDCLFHFGVRPAEPGEFTKRAFLNGRMDLSKAEAVMDLIHAKTEESRRAAVEQLSGSLSRELAAIRHALVSCLAEIEVSIDYPEYEMDGAAGVHTMEVLAETQQKLEHLRQTYHRGRVMREGLKMVIAGRPNAGKSSLLNALSGFHRAIVTDIPGTTRDLIEEWIDLDGLPVVLIDTAGLRDASDLVEQIGIQKAEEAIAQADLVLYLVDVSDCEESQRKIDEEQLARIPPDRCFLIINKTDQANREKIDKLLSHFPSYPAVETSLLRGDGLDLLCRKIKERYCQEQWTLNSQAVLTNARHKERVDRALEAIQKAMESYRQQMPLDCISYDLWQCGQYLGEITGESVQEDVLDEIFSRFCLGK